MIEIRRSIGVPVVCALMAMSLQGCEFAQMSAIGTLRDVFDSSPLCDAIVAGNVDRAIQLVKQGKDVNAASGCAVYRAAERGQLEVVKLLLDHKADPNRYDSPELTPLKGAVVSRKVQMVQMLLEGGANPRNDSSAFEVVLNLNNAEMAELLLRYGANANMTLPSREAVFCRASPLSGAGTNLLYYAVRGTAPDNQRIVKLLLDYGADPNAKTINGSTPLMAAARFHDHRLMTMLMDAGADVEATDGCGSTAADYAALNTLRAYQLPQTKALLQERQRK